jgi:hypothetical protein
MTSEGSIHSFLNGEDPYLVYGPSGPWGEGDHNLNRRNLTLDEKYWLASAVAYHNVKARFLAIRLNLGDKVIRKYSSHLKQRGYLRASAGRPRILDNQSVDSLKQFCAQPLPYKHEVKDKIQLEHNDTLIRQYGPNASVVKRPVSTTSSWRYRKNLPYIPSFQPPNP